MDRVHENTIRYAAVMAKSIPTRVPRAARVPLSRALVNVRRSVAAEDYQYAMMGNFVAIPSLPSVVAPIYQARVPLVDEGPVHKHFARCVAVTVKRIRMRAGRMRTKFPSIISANVAPQNNPAVRTKRFVLKESFVISLNLTSVVLTDKKGCVSPLQMSCALKFTNRSVGVMVKLMAMHVVPFLKDNRICATENVCRHVAMTVIVVRVLVSTHGHSRRECVPFVETGESCGGFTPPEYQRRCAPDHECLQLDFLLADAPVVVTQHAPMKRFALRHCL